MSSVHHGDIMILMGDFNAQVGSSNINLENVMGRHGVGSMNRNGELFTEMCAKYNMVIGGTLFPHRTIHKVTWMSPDHVTENQIDHMAISKKWRGSLLDVRNKRGADISSDHHLLVGTIRIKLAAIKNSSKTTARKFDVVKLSQAPVAERYVATLQAALENNNMINRNDWEKVKCTFLDAADKHLGHCQHQRKPWMSELTWQLIENRKSAKGLLNSAKTRSQKSEFARAHSDLDKQVKRSARRDKRAFTDGLAKEAQAAAATNRTRDLYRITKKLTTKSIVSTRPLKNSSGELVTSKTQQLEIWTNHYTELLKTPSQPNANICNCSGHTVRPDISTSSPSVMEVTEAIKALKLNKAPGTDNIAPEMLKADPNVSARLILPIIEEFWRTECLHDELKEGIIVKVPKKGNLSECSNWRGITLLSMINKVVAHIITGRLTALEPELRPEQAGFRPRKSCVDQVNTLRVIVEQSVEWRSPLYLVFIDFEKAFDKLAHDTIWKALECKGTPPKLISLIRSLYSGSTCRVLHENILGSRINVNTGVRQGCVMSPLLFNIVLDVVMKTATENSTGIQWGLHKRLGDLDYADDICLLAHTFSDMSQKLRLLEAATAKAGLKINIGKTKSMRVNTDNRQSLELNGTVLEDINSFCYLGSIINNNGGSSADIVNRINCARRSFGILRPVWKASHISRKTKICLFNSNVKSSLLYGCETWNAAARDITSLQVFANRCLRRILKIFWPNVISNYDLWTATNQVPLRTEILRRKWNWLGHTLRKPADDLTRAAIDWNPQGTRRRGRPAHTWRRQLDSEIAATGKSWNEIKLIACNRSQWNAFVMALCSNLERRE